MSPHLGLMLRIWISQGNLFEFAEEGFIKIADDLQGQKTGSVFERANQHGKSLQVGDNAVPVVLADDGMLVSLLVQTRLGASSKALNIFNMCQRTLLFS